MVSSMLKGIVHGKTIELEREPGLPEGTAVVVTIQRVQAASPAIDSDAIDKVQLWLDRLVFDSAVLPGQRIVKGTRLEAEKLVAELEQGHTEEQLLKAHPQLSKEDVEALRYYAKVPVGIRRSAGAWAEDSEELDKFIEWTYEQRKIDRPPLEP